MPEHQQPHRVVQLTHARTLEKHQRIREIHVGATMAQCVDDTPQDKTIHRLRGTIQALNGKCSLEVVMKKDVEFPEILGVKVPKKSKGPLEKSSSPG